MAYQTSQGLASLGRNGDSMLVHMNPTEVAGLQSLAMSQGGSLTINPQTGLPEAFSLSGVFSSLLPMFAGAMFPGAGFAMQPLLAGALTGGVLAKVQGKDPLMGGLMGGLGGIGGSNLAQGLGGAAGATGSAVQGGGGYVPSLLQSGKQAVTQGAGIDNLINQGYNINTGLADKAVMNPALQSAMNTVQQTGGALPNTGSFLDKELTALSNAGRGAGNLITGKPGAFQGFKDAFIDPTTGTGALTNFEAATKIGLPVGGALLGGLEPSDIYGEPINMDEAKKKQAYNPNATLNLSGDTGLRLYATGGTIQSGGIRDLYGTPDNQPTISPGLSGFGLGRLNNLAGEQAMTQAQTLGYADGGDVVAGERGMNLDDLPSLNVNTGEQGFGGKSYYMTPDGSGMYAGRLFKDLYRQSPNPLFKLFSQLPNDKVFTRQMAQGGPVSFADGGDSNKEDALGLPSLSPDMAMDPNAGAGNLAMIQSAMQPTQGMQGNAPMAQGQMPDQSNDSLIAKVTANLRADPNYQPTNPIEASIVKQIRGTDPMQQGQPSLQGLGSLAPSQPITPSFNPSVAMGPTYFAGMNAPRSMAKGGYLNGAGDGMSDSIPATIEGKQPARLADGEFVVPADVVSHLGNGSSKAGSKRLYAMLDKVRHARTGNKKQGKEIKPEKYMPA
jgi:hypothetical protein